jgi:hypothetical protein
MKALSRIMNTMAALGITAEGMPRFRVSKHAFNQSKANRGRKRLRIARGAGSISAKADILQLCRTSHWLEAANMAEEHERQCGERLFSPTVLEVWRSYAIEEAITS